MARCCRRDLRHLSRAASSLIARALGIADDAHHVGSTLDALECWGECARSRPAARGIAARGGRSVAAEGDGATTATHFGELDLTEICEDKGANALLPCLGNDHDPPVSDPVSGASSLEGIGEKPPEDQVQPYDNEERPEDGKFQRCALPDHHRFPEDGETAPKEAERDEKDIASAQHESRLRPTRPQQPLASLQ